MTPSDSSTKQPERPTRIAVLLSGSGRTLQNLLDRSADGSLPARIVCTISDRADAYGLDRARRAEVPTMISKDPDRIWSEIERHEADLVCLAGYLRLLPIPEAWSDGRVLNIHPSLLPRHGGRGMYGDRVHRAVIEAGDRESGCTVHVCDDRYDTGPVVLQHTVPVHAGDTAESLAARVFEAECEAYPEAIRQVIARTHGTTEP